jgi:hypothetical protein
VLSVPCCVSLFIEVPAISGMSLVFLNSARQALLLDPLNAGGTTTAVPRLCDARGARRPSSF